MQAEPTTTVSHSGGRRRGAVRFETALALPHFSDCHCGDCSRATGAPFSAFVGLPADGIGFAVGAPHLSEKGPLSRNYRATCGSPIAYIDARLEDQVWFMPGAMDYPQDCKPTMHTNVREQLSYIDMSDDLPRLARSSVARSGIRE